jgi:integrase
MRAAMNVIAVLLGDSATRDADGRDVTYLGCNWAALRYAHTAALRARLVERYEPATANVKLAALRGVLAEAWRLGLMTAEDYHRATDLKSVTAAPLLRGRALDGEEIATLLAACAQDETAFGVRDAAIIAVMYSTTLRRSEVAALQLRDYNVRERSLKVVKGKGRKDRLVYLADGAFEALEAWLELRGRTSGPLFCRIKERGRKGKDGQVQKEYVVKIEHGLSDQAIYNLLAKRRELAAVEHFTPHDIRRTSISDLLDAEVDVVTVANISGHASTDMVKRYDRRGEKAKRKAVQRLRVPYPRSEPDES